MTVYIKKLIEFFNTFFTIKFYFFKNLSENQRFFEFKFSNSQWNLKEIFFKQFGLLHEKNSFAEVRKKLGKFEHNFIGSSKLYKIASNYIEHPNWLLEYQNFLLIMLEFPKLF